MSVLSGAYSGFGGGGVLPRFFLGLQVKRFICFVAIFSVEHGRQVGNSRVKFL
jgi:hypothetical protein